MHVVSRTFVRTLMLVLAVGLLASCGGKEERKAKYLERGKEFFAEQNHDKAKIEFKNVLQIDPKTAEAYLYLGEIEEKKQNWPQAFGNYKKASELDPEMIDARIHLAQLYMAQATALRAQEAPPENLANALGLAQEEIQAILTRDPDNVDGLTLEATLWVHEGDVEKATERLEQIIKSDAGAGAAAMLLASIYLQNDRPDDAESVLLNAIAKNENSIGLQTRLAGLYTERRMNDKAEDVLRKIAADNPDELAHRVSLASFLARTDQVEKAEKVLRDTIAADPADTQRYLLLAEFLAAKRGNEAAIEELNRLVAQHPDLPDLRLALVRFYMADDQRDKAEAVLTDLIDAEGTQPTGIKARLGLAQLLAADDPDATKVQALLKEVLDANPRDNDALLLRGKLALRKRNYGDAIGDFRSVLKDQPNSPEVLQLLASAHASNGEIELARDSLVRGIESNPTSADLRLTLAELLARSGDPDRALEQVEAVLRNDKDHERALAAKFEILKQRQDVAGMEAVAKRMQVSAPSNEAGFIREAQIRIAQQDYAAAIAILDGILEKDPRSVAALVAKSDALAGQKDFAAAIPVAEQLQKVQPDSVIGYYRKGKLLEQQGEDAAALEQYEKALEKEPGSAEAFTALINLEVKHSGTEKVEQRLLDLLAADARHPYANEFLGLIYQGSGRFAEAEKAFQAQIAISPENSLIYAQLAEARLAQSNTAGAAEAFQQGLEAMPGDVRLLIGLAGVEEARENFDAAVSLYEQVLEQQPDNAVSINNLAALLSDHRSDPQSLEKAAELAAKLEKTNQPAFIDTAGWVYYRQADYEKAIRLLKNVVEQAPEIAVFRYHLGMAYYKNGDKAAAREHLQKATEDGREYTGVDEARATLANL